MAKVTVEGNTLTLDDSICRENKSLIAALAPYYPAVANAEIKRETAKDGTMTVKVTKKAGKKGYAPVVKALAEAPETIAPILVIEASGKKHGSADLDHALLQMLEDDAEISRVLGALKAADGEAANTLPKGF
jgi:hypothetical protein